LQIWRIVDLINWTTEYFQKRNIPTARLDAELLLGCVLGKERLQLYLDFDEVVQEEHLSQYRELVKKRAEYMPVAYLTNQREFMSLKFYVNENVLIPRPETERLVETVLDMQSDECVILEVGTGNGAIAVSFAKKRPNWKIFATDISEEALQVAEENAHRHEVSGQLTFLHGALFEPLSGKSEKFDWIVSNPPYVPSDRIPTLAPDIKDYEPRLAIDGGADGLDIIRRLIAEAPDFLTVTGKLAFEIDDTHSDAVKNLISENDKYADYEIIKDYAGVDRVVVAQRNAS